VPADSVSIRIYSGIARFPCDSMAFLLFKLQVASARSTRLALVLFPAKMFTWCVGSLKGGRCLQLINVIKRDRKRENDLPQQQRNYDMMKGLGRTAGTAGGVLLRSRLQ